MKVSSHLACLAFILQINFYKIDAQNQDSVEDYTDEYQSLIEFQSLLSEFQNTDYLILVDVGKQSKSFLENLKNISKDAIKCLYKLSEQNNTAAIVTFASKPKLQVNFCSDCYKDKDFISKTDKDIRTLNESRSVIKALKKSLRLLKKQREVSGQTKRTQTILLITFGIDETTKYLGMNRTQKLASLGRLGRRLLDEGINLAIAGVGDEARLHKVELNELVKNQPQKYFAIVNRESILDILELLIGYSCIPMTG